MRLLRNVSVAAVYLATCLQVAIAQTVEQFPTPEKPAGHENALEHLAGDRLSKLRELYRDVRQDAEVRAAEERRKQAERDYDAVLRAAVLKRDPSLKPIVDQIPNGKLRKVFEHR